MDELIAGVDEAGRGPLAGPVVVASVILAPDVVIDGLNDSKKLNEKTRETLYVLIREQALACSVVQVAVADIDRLNILRATLWGMQQAVAALSPRPSLALIDGNQAPDLPCPARCIVGGDGLEPVISAASILAKVVRDRIMRELHTEYPAYGFDHNKGYATPEHIARLRDDGPCPIHRRSFAPVREAMQGRLF